MVFLENDAGKIGAYNTWVLCLIYLLRGFTESCRHLLRRVYSLCRKTNAPAAMVDNDVRFLILRADS